MLKWKTCQGVMTMSNPWAIFGRYYAMVLAVIVIVAWVWARLAHMSIFDHTLPWWGLGVMLLGGLASMGDFSSRHIMATQQTYQLGNIRREYLDESTSVSFSFVMIAAGLTALVVSSIV